MGHPFTILMDVDGPLAEFHGYALKKLLGSLMAELADTLHRVANTKDDGLVQYIQSFGKIALSSHSTDNKISHLTELVDKCRKLCEVWPIGNYLIQTRLTDKNNRHMTIADMWARIGTPFKYLEPTPEAIDVVMSLKALDGHLYAMSPFSEPRKVDFHTKHPTPYPKTISFCTDPGPYYQNCADKVEWLANNFGSIFQGHPFPYILTKNKPLLAHSRSLLIDDHKDNCEGFVAQGGWAVLYPTYWSTGLPPKKRLECFREQLQKFVDLCSHPSPEGMRYIIPENTSFREEIHKNMNNPSGCSNHNPILDISEPE